MVGGVRKGQWGAREDGLEGNTPCQNTGFASESPGTCFRCRSPAPDTRRLYSGEADETRSLFLNWHPWGSRWHLEKTLQCHCKMTILGETGHTCRRTRSGFNWAVMGPTRVSQAPQVIVTCNQGCAHCPPCAGAGGHTDETYELVLSSQSSLFRPLRLVQNPVSPSTPMG